jgi:hypothetical protein
VEAGAGRTDGAAIGGVGGGSTTHAESPPPLANQLRQLAAPFSQARLEAFSFDMPDYNNIFCIKMKNF